MPQSLEVSLLGDVRIAAAGVPIRVGSRKALGVFVAVVLGARPRSRGELAALFWGRRDEAAALTSLRTALQRLPADVRVCLDVSRDRIALREGARLDIDAARFEALARADDVAALEAASTLYRGDLLHGFDADATPEFDDWLLRERTRLRQLAQSVFSRLIAIHHERARRDVGRAAVAREAALATAQHWLDLDPAAEAAHRWLMQIHFESGRFDAALAQFELCRRALAVGQGRAPSAETAALAAAIASRRATGPEPAAGPEGAPHADAAAPVAGIAATRFVGREREIAALLALFADPAVRLVTLHGLGGMGKTRLAHVLTAPLAPRYPQGAAWVSLESLDDGARLAETIARALGIELSPRLAADDALCLALREQRRLLVLDNVEHLLPGAADLVLEIVQQAPGVDVLVTSREVLGLQEEWVFDVPGLPVPERDGDAAAAPADDAAALFVQRARQAWLGFAPAAEWPHVLAICRAVEGLPLAIELAAAWVRTMPVQDIAAGIAAELAAAASRHRNRPARQQSIDAVVLYSWRLLSSEQQNALAALSVLIGSFTQDAARAIAAAPARTLSALVDKALVTRRPDGRLALHALVRRFAAQALADDAGAEAAARARHGEHFVAQLLAERARLDGPGEIDAEATIAAERANVEAAARRGLDGGDAAAAERIAEPLLHFVFSQGDYRRVVELASACLARAPLPPAVAVACGMYLGRALSQQGRDDAADAAFTAAIAAAAGSDDAALEGAGHLALAYATSVEHARGDFAGALARLAPAAAYAARSGDLLVRLRVGYSEGMFRWQGGDPEGARAPFDDALEAADALAAPLARATVLTGASAAVYLCDDVDGAIAMARDALAVFARTSRRNNTAILLCNLAVMELRGGDAAGAERSAREALALFEALGMPAGISASAHALGAALHAQGDGDAALACYERALGAGNAEQRAEARWGRSRIQRERGDVVAMAGEGRALLEGDAPAAAAVATASMIAAAIVAADAAAHDRRAGAAWYAAAVADPATGATLAREAGAALRDAFAGVAPSADGVGAEDAAGRVEALRAFFARAGGGEAS